MHRADLHAALVAKVLTVQCSSYLMYGVVDVDVDIVEKIVILVPVTARFTLKTLELSEYSYSLRYSEST